MTYSVNFWASHPENGNDDCNCGEDFDTEIEALIAYNDPFFWVTERSRKSFKGSYIELDGPGVYEVKMRPGFDVAAYERELERELREERQEFAMQAGMAFGCDGYNDAMGY